MWGLKAMRTLTPTVQNNDTVTVAETRVARDPDTNSDQSSIALWVGFFGGFIVFILVLLLIIQGRVIKPAHQHAARSKAASQPNFFEPAGEEAEITFEDPDTQPPEKESRGFFGFGKKEKKQRDHLGSLPSDNADHKHAAEEHDLSLIHI